MEHIAFIGTGIMGSRMAARLLAAKYPVRAWNRSIEKTQPLEEQGARVALTPSEAARGADVVITMLSDGASVAEVLFDKGIAEAMNPGAVVIDMSSIPPPTAREHHGRLKARGVGHIDAPVSGGPTGAEKGTLAIMAGGDEDVFARVETALKQMGRPVLVGPAGSGQLAKLCNQVIVAVTVGAVSEALLLAAAGGADPAKVREALTGGYADSLILKLHGQRMLDRDFRPGGPSRLQLKDLRTILAAAKEAGLTLPLASRMTETFTALVDRGGGQYDHSAALLELERLNAPKRLGSKPDILPS
jgi:2-hydroxy-3-oxopropionate reductase